MGYHPRLFFQETGVVEQRIKVGTLREIPRSYGKVVQAGGKLIALFKMQDTVYAIDNECPHRGGPIGEGSVRGKLVSCPGTSGPSISPLDSVSPTPMGMSAAML